MKPALVPGATALQFYTNNTGAVRDCRFLAGEDSGAVGLDLAHREMNGPLLVSRCEIEGFATGVACAGAVNSQTFENLTLRDQRQFGLDNAGQAVSVRGLASESAVPAVRSHGTTLLVDAKLTGNAGAERGPAVINYNGGVMFLWDVRTSGYGRALADLRNFRIGDGDSPAVIIEHFGYLGGGIEIDTRRAVVVRSLESHTLQGTARSSGGDVFLEDVEGNDFRFRNQQVWVRQLNIENLGTRLTNDAGSLWVLGYKTESGGTLAHTLAGGRTEVLGGFSYTTTDGTLPPMFINDNAALWTFFAEVCYSGDPFALRMKESRGGTVRTLAGPEVNLRPFSGHPAEGPAGKAK